MDIDTQTAFNALFTAVGLLGGWILNSLKSAVDGLQRQDQILADKVQHIEVLVAGQYVKRDAFDRVCDKLFTKMDEQTAGLSRIEEKLNGKADK